MKFNYEPKNNLEKFGVKVYSALVENFSQTFFVGGMVRDLLLGRKITDVDIATNAKPEEIILVLQSNGINFNSAHANFGVILAQKENFKVEIATFRKEVYIKNRYPTVSFIQSPESDSQRRDFTINALYLSLKQKDIKDFHHGFTDLKKKQIKFIGHPETRILEDPLRVIRAMRFALELNFKLEKNTKAAIKKLFYATTYLTVTKLNSEMRKVVLKKDKLAILKVINNPKLLDKYFK
jgi:tRNA nucleotidyltransferase/poly(A) polymerase